MLTSGMERVECGWDVDKWVYNERGIYEKSDMDLYLDSLAGT